MPKLSEQSVTFVLQIEHFGKYNSFETNPSYYDAVNFRAFKDMNSVCIMFPSGEAARVLATRNDAMEF